MIVSDWGAQHSLAPSANGGLDMAMPAGISTSASVQISRPRGRSPLITDICCAFAAVRNGSTYVGEFAIAVQNGQYIPSFTSPRSFA